MAFEFGLRRTTISVDCFSAGKVLWVPLKIKHIFASVLANTFIEKFPNELPNKTYSQQ